MNNYYLQMRSQRLLEALLEADGWITSSILSRKLGVSDRTIRSDIKELGAFLKRYQIRIISKRSEGYRLDLQSKAKIRHLIDTNEIVVYGEGELTVTILIDLLSENAACDADDLCEKYFVSRTTLEEQFKKIRSLIRIFDDNVMFIRKNNTVQIIAEEKTVRQLMNFLIINHDHSRISMDLRKYKRYFDLDEMSQVKKIVLNQIKQNGILISDTGIVAVTLHIMINLERMRKGMILQSSYFKKEELNEFGEQAERIAAKEITRQLTKCFGVAFNAYEIDAIGYHISFRRFFPSVDMHKEQLIIQERVKQVLDEISFEFLLDISGDKELITGISYHFSTLMQRLDCKIYYQNPILQEFKDKYPFIFELAVFARKRFMELLDIELNEDEIGFIAIHFGAAIERLKFLDEPKRINTALVSHLDYPSSQLLLFKLRSSCGAACNIYGPYSSFDLNSMWDCDPKLIVTTSSLCLGCDAQIIKISPVLTRANIDQINQQAKRALSGMKKKLDFKDFFQERFFRPNLMLQNKDEVIRFMAGELIEAGYVPPSFEKAVFKREEFSSTVIKNLIAMPHPMDVKAHKTVISAALLTHPIAWTNRKAQIIFMLAVAPEDQKLLEMFFELVVELSDDEDYVDRILKVKDFDEFLFVVNRLWEEKR